MPVLFPLVGLTGDTPAAHNLGKPVNSKHDEAMPALSADGYTMIFQTNREDPADTENWDLWIAYRTGQDNWMEPSFLRGINSEVFDGHASLTPDGKILYFASNRPDGEDQNIYRAERGLEGWRKPKKLPAPLNSAVHETFPSITADERILYFTRPDGIYRSRNLSPPGLEPVKWSKPEKLSSVINQGEKAYDDLAGLIHVDGKTLYFSSRREGGMGGWDLYSSRETEDNVWSKPANLGPAINSKGMDLFVSVDADGKRVFFSSRRPGSRGEDIYWQNLSRENAPHGVILVTGKVFHRVSKSPVKGSLEVYDLSDGEVLNQVRTDKNGQYSLVLNAGRKYGVTVVASGFFTLSDSFDLRKKVYFKKQTRDFGLAMISDKGHIPVNNIFFDSGSANLDRASYRELDRLIQILIMYPKLRVEIEGHTDNRGSRSYNQKLSSRRAEAVRDYLVKKGVAGARLTTKGLGPDRPRADNDTAEGRARNRRIEFLIR